LIHRLAPKSGSCPNAEALHPGTPESGMQGTPSAVPPKSVSGRKILRSYLLATDMIGSAASAAGSGRRISTIKPP